VDAWQPNCVNTRSGLPVIPVQAAFGGLGIYRAATLRTHTSCEYASLAEIGGGCEHTPLHKCLFEKQAKLLLVPRLRVDWEGCSGPLRDVDPGNYGRTGDPAEPAVTA